jgi:hypothetical protein
VIDEAFQSFAQIVERMTVAPRTELEDEELGVRMRVTRIEVESPVELCVVRDEDGTLRIGSTPPLYSVDTSIRPSLHGLTFTAELEQEPQEPADV